MREVEVVKKDIDKIVESDRIQLLNVGETKVQILILLLESQQPKLKIIKNKLNPKRKITILQTKNLLLVFHLQAHLQMNLLQVLPPNLKRKL